MNLEKRLGFDNGYLVGIGMEGVNVQFVPSCLKVDVAERLEAGDGQRGELYKDASIACKAFEVDVALAIQICTHFLDLKIGHVAHGAI